MKVRALQDLNFSERPAWAEKAYIAKGEEMQVPEPEAERMISVGEVEAIVTEHPAAPQKATEPTRGDGQEGEPQGKPEQAPSSEPQGKPEPAKPKGK